MAFQKLYKVVQDSPVGYQTVNQLADNAADLRAQMIIEHGSNDPSTFLQRPGAAPAVDYRALGRHNLVEIPRGVAQTATFSSFAGFGSFSTGLSWTGAAITACYWLSTGVYFLPVVGLSTFWGKAAVLAAVGVTPLEPQVRSLLRSAANGGVNGLQVSLFQLDTGDFVPVDLPFTVALYGAP